MTSLDEADYALGREAVVNDTVAETEWNDALPERQLQRFRLGGDKLLGFYTSYALQFPDNFIWPGHQILSSLKFVSYFPSVPDIISILIALTQQSSLEALFMTSG